VTRAAFVARGALGALALGTALAVTPSSAAPPAKAAPSATTAAAVSAPWPLASGTPAPPRPVLGVDLPREPSPAPGAAEWSTGRQIAPTRGDAGRCVLTVLREWLRVRCPGLPGAGLVAGEPDGVSVRTLGRAFTDEGLPGDLVTVVVLPLRSGQTRVVTFNDLAIEYDSTALVEGGMLSVVWRPGRRDPVLAMYGIPAATPGPAKGAGSE
jgi:hypothetical protein